MTSRVLPTEWLRRAGRRLYAHPAGKRLLTRIYAAMAAQPQQIRNGPLKGLRIITAGANAGYALGIKEPQVQREIDRLLQPGMVAYDIGANVGFFTIQAARLVGDSGAVVAFEPFAANLPALRRNIALNTFANVSVLELAVGATTGSGSMLENEGAVGGSTARLADQGETPGHPVDVTTLDDLLAGGRTPAPHFVKIDVEGAEVDVIRGATRVLLDARPTVLCEVHDVPGDDWRDAALRALFDEANYSVRQLEEDGEDGMRHIVATPR